ncbi:protein kinase [Achlya hypogyna]|uniref:Protein kinase n=1 Tax=Achlya hypogyna TaxID=1202772 RepID=A0A1V9ZG06_ACHHY|nr:protein kinase [Achlya hypogyna]
MQRNSEFSGPTQRFQKSASWKGRSNSHDMTQSSSGTNLNAAPAAGAAGEFVSSKTGYLTKRSIGSIDALANWRERFFVLAEAKLCYYKVGGGFFSKKKEEEQDLAHFKGQLELSPDTVVKKSNIDNKANCFEINTGDKRMFAQANTAKECEDWIKMIRAHVTALQQQRLRKSGSGDEVKPTAAQFEASVFASSAATMGGPKANDQDYTRPSLLESHDIVRGAEASTDPKDVVIKQLLEENRQLREQLMLKDQIIHELETNNGQATLQQARDTLVGSAGLGSNRSLPRVSSLMGAPKQMLDLRDLRKKQIQLFDAAEVGNFHLISTLLRDNVIDINGVGINQCTALHLAARNNHAKAVAELVGRGADISARTADRLTPLHLAAMEGHASCVEELLKAGADPNTTDQNGNGAIHLAAEGGNIACAKLLIAYGARTDVPNASGSLPVHISPIGHPIRVLLSGGTAANAVNPVQPPRIDPSDVGNKSEMHVTFKNKYHESLALGPRDFEFVKVLGRGAFAKVYLVRGKGANKDKWFALKAYNKQAIVQKNQAQYIHTEKAALQACSDHPFIVSLYYAFQSQDRLFLVMEYCGGGDLLSTLTRRKAFTEPEAAFYIGQIVLALSHLHSKGIVFRDLKPENVVLDLDGNALLTDFGISKEGVADHSSANTFCGSPMYLAPEMLSRSGHGFALDWYSVGALLFELLTGLPPFYTNDKKQLFHNILRGNLTIPEYISPQARDLIQRLLWKDPNQRLGSGPRGDKEIMDHPFFASIDWNKLYRKEISPPFKPKIDAGNGVPDTSNFPNSFTEQEITEIERGLAPPPAGAGTLQRSASKEQKEAKLFKDFDFTPEVKLDNEATLFEAQLLLHQNSVKNQKPPPLVESDEYSI